MQHKWDVSHLNNEKVKYMYAEKVKSILSNKHDEN